jgi:nucleoside-diphosphate-sugar epimerase
MWAAVSVKGGLRMSDYLVVGASAIGAALAQALADHHHQVRLVSRRGSGPEDPNITRVAADAKNADALGELAARALAIFNCVNPGYHRWATDWPPVADSLLASAEGSGAVLVTLSNLYGYGRPTGPMTPDSPLLADYEKAQVRVKMWRDAKAAHDARRLRETEVRASDYIGPRAESAKGERVFPRVLAGKGCQILGSADVPHSWTYTGDVVATLIACAQNTPWPGEGSGTSPRIWRARSARSSTTPRLAARSDSRRRLGPTSSPPRSRRTEKSERSRRGEGRRVPQEHH